MKKILSAAKICAILLLAAVLCCSCIPYNGERPIDYPHTRWTSETPHVWFDVTDVGLMSELGKDYDAEGVWVKENGETVAIAVLFDYVDGVVKERSAETAEFFSENAFSEKIV